MSPRNNKQRTSCGQLPGRPRALLTACQGSDTEARKQRQGLESWCLEAPERNPTSVSDQLAPSGSQSP